MARHPPHVLDNHGGSAWLPFILPYTTKARFGVASKPHDTRSMNFFVFLSREPPTSTRMGTGLCVPYGSSKKRRMDFTGSGRPIGSLRREGRGKRKALFCYVDDAKQTKNTHTTEKGRGTKKIPYELYEDRCVSHGLENQAREKRGGRKIAKLPEELHSGRTTKILKYYQKLIMSSSHL